MYLSTQHKNILCLLSFLCFIRLCITTTFTQFCIFMILLCCIMLRYKHTMTKYIDLIGVKTINAHLALAIQMNILMDKIQKKYTNSTNEYFD